MLIVRIILAVLCLAANSAKAQMHPYQRGNMHPGITRHYGPQAAPQQAFDDGDDDPFSHDPFSRDTGADFDDEPGYPTPDSGNWYEKLRWWKEAKQLYNGDIHDAIEHVKIIASEFDEKKAGIFKSLDEFNKALPVPRTAALPLIATLTDEVKKAKEQIVEPQSKEEKAEVAAFEEQLKGLEQLKGHFETFNGLVSRLDEASNVVFKKQIELCYAYDEKALAHFDRIEKILDDEKAHDYYDIMENCLENIRAIINYLVGPLHVFVDESWVKVQDLMPKIKSSIADLSKLGVEVRVLTEKEKAEQAALKKQKEEARKKAMEAKKAAEARAKMSWWQKIFASIADFFSSIWNGITSVFSSIGSVFSSGKPSEAKKAAPAEKPQPMKTPASMVTAQSIVPSAGKQ